MLVVLVVLLTIWLWNNDEQQDSTVSPTSSYDQTSDYSMTQFTMTIMDENGRPSRVIKGQQMAHYPEDDTTRITDPVAEFANEQQEIWQMTAKHGSTQGKGEVILLTEDVIINSKANNDIELQTEKLTLDTEHSTAYTDAAVTILSPYGETNSVGLHATLEDKTINLHSKVKGHYNAPPSQ